MKSSAVLADFIAYCQAHPELRFWQALLSWSGRNFIYLSDKNAYDLTNPREELHDTFYWEGKDK